MNKTTMGLPSLRLHNDSILSIKDLTERSINKELIEGSNLHFEAQSNRTNNTNFTQRFNYNNKIAQSYTSFDNIA